jgi:hypothetical protein
MVSRKERSEDSIFQILPVNFKSRIESVVELNRENRGPSSGLDTPARFNVPEQNYEKLEN